MDMFAINCFLALAHSLKFFSAADTMHLSQSSFSRQIQILERSLGTKLFIRNRLGCELTECGKIFFPFAESVAGEFAEAEHLIEEYKKNNENRLIIYTDCLPNAKLSDMIQKFQDENAEIFVEIRETNGGQAMLLLADDPSAACILNSALGANFDGYEQHPLFSDELVALVGRQHAFAARDTISISMLQDEQLLIMNTGKTPFHRRIIELCQENGFTPKISPNVLWQSTMPEAIARLNMVTIMPRTIAERIYRPDIKILDIEGIAADSIRIVKAKFDASYAAELLFRFFIRQ